MRRKRTIVAALSISASLFILALISGAIDSLQFPPGTPLPSHPIARENEPPPLDLGGAPAPQFGFNMLVVFLPISLLFILGGTIASIRSKRFRYELGLSLFTFIALSIFYGLAGLIHTSSPEPTDWVTIGATGTVEERTWNGEPPTIASAPDEEENGGESWRVWLVVGLAAALLMLGGGSVIEKLRRRAKGTIPAPSGLGEIADWAAEAVERIRAGEDIRSVVQRSYARMADILSRRSDIDPTYLTPREFARSLSRAGMADEHVDRLTEMFELVRYGSRPDARFAESAIACLEAIKRAYAAPA